MAPSGPAKVVAETLVAGRQNSPSKALGCCDGSRTTLARRRKRPLECEQVCVSSWPHQSRTDSSRSDDARPSPATDRRRSPAASSTLERRLARPVANGARPRRVGRLLEWTASSWPPVNMSSFSPPPARLHSFRPTFVWPTFKPKRADQWPAGARSWASERASNT